MAKLSRNTWQKKLLEFELKKFRSFFSSDELFEKAKKKDERLGVATVYRFLADLVKNGKIHSYVCDRRTIYSVDKKSHCHFTCEKCGKVEHIDVKNLDFVKSKVSGSICHFQIDVSGVCSKCEY